MPSKTKLIAGAAVVVAAAGAGAGIAMASAGEDDSEPPITGAALEKASAAALESTGGGRVTGTEVGDEEGYYEVEVTRDGGGQVDVHLDQDFNVLGSEADQDGGEDEANEEN